MNMKKKMVFKKLQKMLGIAAVMITFVLGCGALVGCGGSKKIDLSQYVSINVEGYNGYATATATFDHEKFAEDYADKISFSNSSNEGIKLLRSLGETNKEIFADVLTGSLSKTTEISNDDILTYTFDMASDFDEIFTGYKMESTTITHQVSGLEAVETFDPFAELSVTFMGDNSSRKVTVTKPDTEMWKSMYVNTKAIGSQAKGYNDFTSGKAGDKFIVVISYGSNENAFIEKYNKVPEVLEKEYTVSSFAEYPLTLSGLDSKFISQCKEDTGELIDTFMPTYNKNAKVEYIGSYYKSSNTGKPIQTGFFSTSMNQYFLVYKVSADVVADNVPYGSVTYYKVYYYEDIEKDSNGICSTGMAASMGDTIKAGLEDLPWSVNFEGYASLEKVEEAVYKNSQDASIEKDF